jgi:hypothetical protein
MLKKIKPYILPVIIALSALSVSASAAFYSITGLSKLFAGASLAVIIMASSLEIAKLVIASLLYQYWDKLNVLLKVYLTIAVTVLILITSAGIYGFLSSAYQDTANKSSIIDQHVLALETKKQSYVDIKNGYLKDKESVSKSTSELRSALSKGTILQSVDRKGNLITQESKGNRKAFEKQLGTSTQTEDKLNSKIDIINDSIFSIESKILNIKTNNTIAGELGPLKYLANLTGYSMDKIINWFLLIIIFVFDPLAISLVIASNFAFNQIKKYDDISDWDNTLLDGLDEEPIPDIVEEPTPNITEETPPTESPEVQKMREMLNRPDISAYRKNRIIQQLSSENLTKEY